MAFHQAQRNHDEHDCAQRHVHAVEAGQHEEGRAIDARAHGQVQVAVGVDVFLNLEVQEQHPEGNGGPHPQDRRQTLVFFQRVVRQGDGHPGGQQDQRVDQRHVEGGDGLEIAAERSRAIAGPHRFETGPDLQIGFNLFTRARQPGQRQGARVEQCAEESAEEHHLGKDEPAHAPAIGHVDLLAVLAALTFRDHAAKPAEDDVDHQCQARQHRNRAEALRFQIVGDAEHENGQANRHHERPGAGRGDEIAVFVWRCCGHGDSLDLRCYA